MLSNDFTDTFLANSLEFIQEGNKKELKTLLSLMKEECSRRAKIFNLDENQEYETYLKYTLEEYRDFPSGLNILHLAVCSFSESMVEYIVDLFPLLLLEKESTGLTAEDFLLRFIKENPLKEKAKVVLSSLVESSLFSGIAFYDFFSNKYINLKYNRKEKYFFSEKILNMETPEQFRTHCKFKDMFSMNLHCRCIEGFGLKIAIDKERFGKIYLIVEKTVELNEIMKKIMKM